MTWLKQCKVLNKKECKQYRTKKGVVGLNNGEL